MKKFITICLLAFIGTTILNAQPTGGYISISKNAVSLRQGVHPANPSLTTVEILYLGSTNGSINHTLFYIDSITGKKVNYGSCSFSGVDAGSGSNYTWVGLCAGCTLNDIPSTLFDMEGFTCGYVPCWGFDSTVGLKTNPCRGDNDFMNPGTWDMLRVPQLGTTGVEIWKNIFINSDVTITQAVSVEDAKTLTISSGKTLTFGRNNVTTDLGRFEHYSTSTKGTVVNNGTVNGNLSVRYTKFINNGTIAPGNIAAIPFKESNFYNLFCSSSSVMDLKLNNTGSNPGDRLYIDDSCYLNGKLAISFANGFTPQAGNRFNILTSYPIAYTGAFSNLQLPAGVTGYLDYRNQGSYSYVDLVITGFNVPLTIGGFNNVCVGSSIQLTANQPNGTWSATSVHATVSSNGLVTGKAAGTTTIIYTLGGQIAAKTIVVNKIPDVPSVQFKPNQLPNVNPVIGASLGCNWGLNKSFRVGGTHSTLIGNWTGTGAISATNSGQYTTGSGSTLTTWQEGLVTTNNVGGNSSLFYVVTDANGCSSKSGLALVKVCKGIKPIKNQNINPISLTIYPNPANGLFNLSLDKLRGGDKMIISNIVGKKVYEQTLNNLSTIINTHLTKGIYLVSVVTMQGSQTQKLIVE